ncbi:MAG: hypothetical protein ACXVCP_14775 [Bdellovibrio sp.]
MKNRAGQSILETIIAAALISVVGLAFVGGIIAMRKTTKTTVILSSTEKQIADIAENIKSGVENYQVNFDYSDDSLAEVLDPDKLPMAWDNGVSVPRKDCDSCAGTFGYTIQPYESFRGLYKVTLRMTHKSWSEKYRDYIFVVSAK